MLNHAWNKYMVSVQSLSTRSIINIRKRWRAVKITQVWQANSTDVGLCKQLSYNCRNLLNQQFITTLSWKVSHHSCQSLKAFVWVCFDRQTLGMWCEKWQRWNICPHSDNCRLVISDNILVGFYIKLMFKFMNLDKTREKCKNNQC